jgi:hypothetical protein
MDITEQHRMRTMQRDVCGPVKRRLVQSPYLVAQMKADQMGRVNERMQHSSAVRRAYRNPKPKIYRRLRGPHDVTARNARPRDDAVSALKRRTKRRMLATFVNGARERLDSASARCFIPQEHHVYFRRYTQRKYNSDASSQLRSNCS